jgi:XTP/dITP diphosphohydrolase
VRLLLATTNPGKLDEIRPVLAGLGVESITLADVPAVTEPAETGDTFWANAREKAIAYSTQTGEIAVAEDSGLCIDALGGEPGVKSARFLGPAASYPERFAEIYRRLTHVDRLRWSARFVTALAVAQGRHILFETETRVEGTVAPAPAGANGFGYDPIFHYGPFGRTTAELSPVEKTSVSHRARAFRDLRSWLRNAAESQ